MILQGLDSGEEEMQRVHIMNAS